jgi:hypothetical protein
MRRYCGVKRCLALVGLGLATLLLSCDIEPPDLSPSRGGIEGTVYRIETSIPLPDVLITCYQSIGEIRGTVSDSAGHYEIDDLRSGQNYLTAHMEGSGFYTEYVGIPAGGVLVHDIYY